MIILISILVLVVSCFLTGAVIKYAHSCQRCFKGFESFRKSVTESVSTWLTMTGPGRCLFRVFCPKSFQATKESENSEEEMQQLQASTPQPFPPPDNDASDREFQSTGAVATAAISAASAALLPMQASDGPLSPYENRDFDEATMRQRLEEERRRKARQKEEEEKQRSELYPCVMVKGDSIEQAQANWSLAISTYQKFKANLMRSSPVDTQEATVTTTTATSAASVATTTTSTTATRPLFALGDSSDDEQAQSKGEKSKNE